VSFNLLVAPALADLRFEISNCMKFFEIIQQIDVMAAVHLVGAPLAMNSIRLTSLPACVRSDSNSIQFEPTETETEPISVYEIKPRSHQQQVETTGRTLGSPVASRTLLLVRWTFCRKLNMFKYFRPRRKNPSSCAIRQQLFGELPLNFGNPPTHNFWPSPTQTYSMLKASQ